ncbi:MAG: hypothetical protein M1834_000666 [Cirrosporium novae-zelandiae]|nr:MAG: hypothetical protein M1834_000666 [Cirrosporium novae-zelandiae]
MKVDISILQTGQTRIRQSMKTQTADRSVFLRRLRALTDRTWTEWLPIYTFLISHPEGYVLFDAGESSHVNDWGYFPLWMPTFRLMSETHIEDNEGIGTQLRERGLGPEDLKAVVISHLHHDHSGGLPDLVGAPVYVSEEHWGRYKNPIKATIEGAVPSQWPQGFCPKILQPTGGPIGPWEHSYPITSDGKIIAVDTPGHTPGHVSLIVFGDNITYFLTGDASYSKDLLDQEVTDGINDNPLLAIESVKKIKAFARQQPLVLLPSHDERAPGWLAESILYKPMQL